MVWKVYSKLYGRKRTANENKDNCVKRVMDNDNSFNGFRARTYLVSATITANPTDYGSSCSCSEHSYLETANLQRNLTFTENAFHFLGYIEKV